MQHFKLQVDVRESSVLSGPNYVEVSSLQPNRRYDIWVKAETSAGYGASSDITSVILGHTGLKKWNNPCAINSTCFHFLVRARIVSFGEVLAVPWKTNLVLDCLHVGEPRPNVLWQHRMRSIRDNSKHQIFPNGSLSIQTLGESDQGDYSCSVQNVHGSDQIIFEIIVQIPPAAPAVLARNVTHTAVELTWTDTRSRKQPVLGYSLFFKKEHGQWETVDTDPLSNKFYLQDLQCGTNYSIYMSAYNHVGAGLPSDVFSARTLGRVPDVPNPDDLLAMNKTLVSIHLEAFGDGGCPVLYFVIEYRREAVREYSMVANNVSPLEKEYTVRGLDPASRYFIKITAHNAAGSSVAEYPFATLTSFGATIPPPVSTARETSLSYPIFVAVKVLTTLFFTACLIVAAFYLTHLVRKWKVKRNHSYHSHHVFFGGSRGSSSSPMFESLSMFAASNGGQGLRQVFSRRRLRRRPSSPTLQPPFKSSDTICSAAGGPASSSASFGPQDTWNKDICPYATFQLPRDQQQQQAQSEVQQVTIKLQHHAQLEDDFGLIDAYRPFDPFVNATHVSPRESSSTTFKASRQPMVKNGCGSTIICLLKLSFCPPDGQAQKNVPWERH